MNCIKAFSWLSSEGVIHSSAIHACAVSVYSLRKRTHMFKTLKDKNNTVSAKCSPPGDNKSFKKYIGCSLQHYSNSNITITA